MESTDKEISGKKSSDTITIKVPSVTKKIKENPWMLSTLIVSVLAIVLLVFAFNGGFTGGAITGGVISEDTAGDSLVSFLNENAPSEVTLNDVSKESGLYKVNVNYQGEVIPVYITLDGKYMASLQPIVTSETGNTDTDEPVMVSEDDDAVKGQNDAPVTIVEFTDYQCPYCGKYYSETYKQIETNYINTGKVRYVLRDFPLGFHENAQKAAEAAECVRDVAGNDAAYWKMHDKLFENMDKLDDASLKSYAKGFGYNIDSCLDSGKFEAEVKKDLADGQSYGVSGTPSFFVNGIPLEGAQPYANFKQVIDAELAKAA